jgi:hypothetical protein
MKLLTTIYHSLFHKYDKKTVSEKLYCYLKDLIALERKIHGITIVDLKSHEEQVLEDTHHVLVLLRKKKKTELKKILKEKDVVDVLSELQKIREDFLYLKKQIQKKEYLKHLISEFTLKCINPENYLLLEKIFTLEKQLFIVLERQDKELEEFYKELHLLRIKKNKDDTVAYFISSLERIRKILAGHLDHHELWEEERSDFSNITHILYSLLSEVKKTLPIKND